MVDKQSSELIRIYAGDNDEGPVFERLPARKIDEYTYELLSSPGLALNLARGDIISIKNQQTHAEVLKRGGNFCIHIYADHIPQEYLTALEVDVGDELNGTLDGIYKGNLSLAIPSRNGMVKVGEFFNKFREKTGVQWYYANVYKNLDDDDDETLLNWWLDS
ncbi:DUF4265 domain-containing protein [Pseudomonas zeae]|uniref:DUF4265 domain-containing protein n=1 Tax=Pseudomonas zeae TaxID=2745510 RepID=UPI0039E16307